MDAVEAILQFNRGREPERLALKYQRMRGDAFAFFRGSCHLFYAQLPPAASQGALRAAPLAWACGDLHLENFGSYKSDERELLFDINDFDEALLAPAHWDLLRLLSSVHLGLPAHAAGLSEHLLAAYAEALMAGRPHSLDRERAQGPVHALLKGLQERKRADFLDRRTSLDKQSGLRRLQLGGSNPKALPATAAQREAVSARIRALARTQARPAFFEVLDVARRVAGTGSLGLGRYVLLVAGKGSPDGNYLLDLKQVLPSSLQARVAARQPAWASEAQRVLSVQRRLQASPMALLQALDMDMDGDMDGRPWILKALQPAEDRIKLEAQSLSAEQAAELLHAMGQLLAWAQLRGAAWGQGGVLAAPAEALADFGRARAQWQPGLLEAVAACSAQARADAQAFDAAFDAGVFAHVRSV